MINVRNDAKVTNRESFRHTALSLYYNESLKFLQGLALDDQQSPCNDESLFYVLFSLSSTEAPMFVCELAFMTDLETKTVVEILRAVGSQASEECDRIELELIPKLEQDKTILHSTIDPDTINPLRGTGSIPPLCFIIFEPYVHFEFAIRFMALWREISRAHWAQQFHYVNILAGTLLEGLLMLGLHTIQQGPDLRDFPIQVFKDLEKDAWNLSWLIQLSSVNRICNERDRQAFHRIRELRNDVHFLSAARKDSYRGLGNEEDADFAIKTIVDFVPKLKIWVQKRGTSKYT